MGVAFLTSCFVPLEESPVYLGPHMLHGVSSLKNADNECFLILKCSGTLKNTLSEEEALCNVRGPNYTNSYSIIS